MKTAAEIALSIQESSATRREVHACKDKMKASAHLLIQGNKHAHAILHYAKNAAMAFVISAKTRKTASKTAI